MTNTGNAPQSYALSVSIDPAASAFQPTSPRLYISPDTRTDFDAAHNYLYVAGSGDPTLAPGASVIVWVVADMPAQVGEGATATVRLGATAHAGSGAPGVVLAGRGAQGQDAVVGRSGAAATATGIYLGAASAPAVELVKSQVVLDPAGGARPVPGALVTYTLTARFTGAVVVTAATLTDPIPTGSTYVAGSLRLDGQPLTDAADGDAGKVTADGVSVTLGDVSAAVQRTIAFQVKINTPGGAS